MTQSTADQVLAALQLYDLKPQPDGSYRCNSPFRPGSNSHAFSLKIDGPEHGCYHDHRSGEQGSLYALAEQLGVRTALDGAPSMPSTKRIYTGLADYAQAHHVPTDAYTAAGWREGRYYEHPALIFPTTTGERFRLLDTPDNAFRSPKGYQRCWYRLSEASTLAQAGGVLVLCNGEPSTAAAQWHGVPATCITGSGERTIPPSLLGELRQAWNGPIVVVLDCDAKGRAAAPALVAQLQAAGFDARAADMRGAGGFDLADFCGLYQGEALAALCKQPDTPADSTERPRFTVASEDVLYDLPPLRYLDRDLVLCAGAFHLIYGASGSGKTFYAIERAMRQASAGRRVLYIPTEDVSGLRYRVAAWRRAYPEASGRLTWLQMPEGLDLQDHRQVAELIEAIAPYEYDHIVLDTLREAHSGDENSSQDTARINRAIQRLVATGAAVDVVHHTGVAGERPRGSTALFANTDVTIRIENDDGLIRVSFEKIRNAPPRDPIAFGLVQQDTGLTDSDGEAIVSCVIRPAAQFTRRDAPMSPAARRILETLSLSIFSQTGAKTRQLVEAAQLPENKSLYRALSWLKDRGYICQGSKGDPYYITPNGRAQLGPEYLSPSPGPDDNDSPTETGPDRDDSDQPVSSIGDDRSALASDFTVNSDRASESATVTTVTALSSPVRQDADTPSVLSVTVTTLRGDSADSGVTGESRQVTVPTKVEELERPDTSQAQAPPWLARINLDYARRMIAVGDEQALRGLRTHCAICKVDYGEVLATLGPPEAKAA